MMALSIASSNGSLLSFDKSSWIDKAFGTWWNSPKQYRTHKQTHLKVVFISFLEKSLIDLLYTLHAPKSGLICVLSVKKTKLLVASTFFEATGERPGMNIWPT